MIPFFGGHLAFMNPWVLAGLLALPVLWFLLRVFPPVPRMIHLPSAWLLEGLVPDQQTTSKTPWWILLMRILMAALILIALAHPVINPAESLNIQGGLRLVIDNGWAASQTWTQQIAAAEQLLDRAVRDRLEVFILPTAPEPGAPGPVESGPLTASQAQTILRALKPHPWPASYGAAIQTLEKDRRQDGLQSFWIGDGLDEGHGHDLAAILQRAGGLTYLEPPAAERPVLLLPKLHAGQDLAVAVTAPSDVPNNLQVGVEAVAGDGRVLDQQIATLGPNRLPVDVKFALPQSLRSQVAQFRIASRSSAGSMLVLDDMFNRRSVGLVAAHDESKSAPLVEAGYYLTRALEPYADLHNGSVEELAGRKDLSVIILPDIGAMPPETLEKLEAWVKDGGLLLRFAGPNMSDTENQLVPIPLRQGQRAMNGALTWEKPQKLAPFPPGSPLYGITPDPDIEVRQQLLAEPVQDMPQHVWASLQDGTPLITAGMFGRGEIVLVHTTATPQWSNLAVSGLYVQMLQRIIALAGLRDVSAAADGTLHPLQVLDGLGGLNAPDSTVRPIDAGKFDAQMPDASHPPGFYGRTGLRKAFNIGDRIHNLTAMPALPIGVERHNFSGTSERNLMPFLLTAAFVLFLFDWAVMVALQGVSTGRLAFLTRGAALALILCLWTGPAMADDNNGISAEMIKQASTIHLAYVRTGVADIDAVSQRGLQAVADTMKERTSVEPTGVVAVNPETDELSFFPLIYWPVSGNEQPLSPVALKHVQFYLDHGGTILFDTRDHGVAASINVALPTRNGQALQNLTRGLDVPPLVEAPKDHVLTKSFYLIPTFPGRYDNASLWVEEQSASGRDGVSSIIVGGNDWGSAWAGVSPQPGTTQREMSLRFGVNLVMYALTGNYKADQVHMKDILERLGR